MKSITLSAMMALLLLGCLRHVPSPTEAARMCPDGQAVEPRVEESLRRGVGWLIDFVAIEENRDALGLDSVILFHELATTSTDPWIREQSQPLITQLWHEQVSTLLSKPQPLSVFDALTALHLASIGADRDMDTAELRRRAMTTFADKTTAAEMCDLPSDRIGDLNLDLQYELLLCAYDLTRAQAQWPTGVDTHGVHLGTIHQELLAGWRIYRPGRPSDERAYLATHHALVLNDYGRLRLDPQQAPDLINWLQITFPAVHQSGDTELMAEYLDVFRSMGHTPADDPLLHAGTCTLLAGQNPDGSWDGPYPAEDPYTAMHPTWTAVTGLRDRTFLDGTPYANHLRALLTPQQTHAPQ